MKKYILQKNKIRRLAIFVLMILLFLIILPKNVQADTASLIRDRAQWETTKTELEARARAAQAYGINSVDMPNFQAQIAHADATIKKIDKQIAEAESDWTLDRFWEKLKKAVSKAGSQAFGSALRSTLNTLAYDTATYLATGDEGQKPTFYTEPFGEFLSNTADNAAGYFIEHLGDYYGANYCEPDFYLKIKIGLGLMQYGKPDPPECTWTEMRDNWEEALQKEDFLTDFQDMFNPTSNDLGIALSLHTDMYEAIQRQVGDQNKQRTEDKGWLRVDNLDGLNKTFPGQQELEVYTTSLGMMEGLKEYTGDALIDAANIFLNQYAITLFNEMMRKLGEDVSPITTPYNWDYLLSQYESGPYISGIAGANQKFKKIVQPDFSVRGDYDILSELSICLNPAKAGPTNCVIDDKFRQAIEKKMTVGEAMKAGYLNGEATFGFKADGYEPFYNEGYPYRSMIILRKFRILPVGWEVAAGYIKDNSAKIHGAKTLEELVNCFSLGDSYDGAGDAYAWCKDLVDPNWVLKAPLNYCRREGPGPEIQSERIIGSGEGSEISLNRNDNYCGDEQSCIKEKEDGSCDIYGYCTEERRKWNFGGESCDPEYNTCMTYRGSEGGRISLLSNTLEYAACNEANAGCETYCNDIDYISDFEYSWTCSESATDNIAYFNNQIDQCDEEAEGCDQYIRVADNDRIIYLKTTPDYFADECAETNPSPPAICSTFSRVCEADQVACELYTSVEDDWSIAAILADSDYCPAECVGYETYIENETYFAIEGAKNLIPKTARNCSAEAVGCEEFTNLDRVGLKEAGEATGEFNAEEREYFTYLRQCQLPSEPGCAQFYTWEGSDDTGYQLRIHNFDGGSEPTDLGGGESCSEAVYNLSPSDPAYNPDCMEFYSVNGTISYHNFSQTIACSDDCHPYRRSLVDQVGACQNGGIWDAAHQACIFMAIPDQGITCSAAQAGCREYDGPEGSNERNVFVSDFEGGHVQGWVDSSGNPVVYSNESVIAGGHSIEISGSAEKTIGGSINEGSVMLLGFVAKGSGSVTARLESGNGAVDNFSTVTINNDGNWRYYKISINALNHNSDLLEKIVITVDGGAAYFDYINLTEIVDRYFLIMNSWNTPASCDTPAPGAMLGCDEYVNRSKVKHYLKSFNELCPEDAVGCERMIDTHNSNDTGMQTFGTDPVVEVPADSEVYIVYNEDNLCQARDKGCERYGEPYYYNGQIIYKQNPLFFKNDPDLYSTIGCNTGDERCDVWTDDAGGRDYFKDPGNQICEYRQSDNQGMKENESWNWWRKRVKYCDDDPSGISGVIDSTETQICDSAYNCGVEISATACSDSDDCPTGLKCALGVCRYSCIEEPLDIRCDPLSNTKTIGEGGLGSRIYTPDVDANGVYWAGLCPSDQSGCSELIDPVSKFGVNIVFNPDFYQDIDGDNNADGWASNRQQNINIKANTLYRFAGKNEGGGSIKISCTTSSMAAGAVYLYELDENNELVEIPTVDGITEYTLAIGSIMTSRLLYAGAYQNCSIEVTGNISVGADSRPDMVELKEVAMGYEIASGLDRSTCNGIVDFEEGCVLFNERAYGSNGFAGFLYDADITIEDGDGLAPVSLAGQNDSNTLLKVSPNRVCNTWLACRSYVTDDKGDVVCLDVGLCDKLDDKGFCRNFLVTEKENMSVDLTSAGSGISAAEVVNMSGYSKVGHAGNTLSADMYPLSSMAQIGELAPVVNGSFEIRSDVGYPIGWRSHNMIVQSYRWEPKYFKTIDNPYDAQMENIGYPIEGESVLRFSAESYLNAPYSEFIEVEHNTDYIISAYINTLAFSTTNSKVNVALNVVVRGFNYRDIEINREIYSYQRGIDSDAVIANIPPGEDWKFFSAKFRTQNGCLAEPEGLTCPDDVDGENRDQKVAKIRIQLVPYSSAGLCQRPGNSNNEYCRGSIYIDDINIKPILLTASSSTGEIDDENLGYIGQTCRLYPEDDSLSCQYYDESGVEYKGWRGYCLEYDRSPGSEDACLLWYPVDKVKGEAIDERAGYNGRYPLYYCLQADLQFDFVEERRTVKLFHDQKTSWHLFGLDISDWGEMLGLLDAGWEAQESDICKGCGCGYGSACPTGYTTVTKKHSSGNSFFGEKKSSIDIYCRPDVGIGETALTCTAWEYGVPCNPNLPVDGQCTEETANNSYPNECQSTENGYQCAYCNDYDTEIIVGGYDPAGPIGRVCREWGVNDKGETVCNIWPEDGNFWYIYDGDLQQINGIDGDSWSEGQTGVKIYDWTLDEIFDISEYVARCEYLVETVNPIGLNKAWTSRTNEGSNYVVSSDLLKYEYGTPFVPYGAVIVPYTDINDLYFSPADWPDARILGSPYYCESSIVNKKPERCEVSGFCEETSQFCTETYNEANWGGAECVNPFSRPEISYFECPDNENCAYDNWASSSQSELDLKRIFAKTYDSYALENRCDVLGGRTCSSREDCECFGCITGEELDSYSGENALAPGTCENMTPGQVYCNILWECNVGTGVCEKDGEPVPGMTTGFCQPPGIGRDGCVDCDPGNWDCVQTCCPKNTNTCVNGENAGGACDDDTDCAVFRCVNGPNSGMLCDPTAIDSDGRSTQCDARNLLCDVEGECINGSCVNGTCSGGTNNNQDGDICSADRDCWCRFITCEDSDCVPTYVPSRQHVWSVPERYCWWHHKEGNYGGYEIQHGVAPRPAESAFDVSPAVRGSIGEEGLWPGDWVDGTWEWVGDYDYCGIFPIVRNLSVDVLNVNRNSFVNLTFNTLVDSDQLPIVSYVVDWGDNEKTAITGVELNHRTSPENPHSLYHLYSYWDLKYKNSINQDHNVVFCGSAGGAVRNSVRTLAYPIGQTTADSGLTDEIKSCPAESDCCMIQPKVKVRDNWGWCNEGWDEVDGWNGPVGEPHIPRGPDDPEREDYCPSCGVYDCNQWSVLGNGDSWITVTETAPKNIDICVDGAVDCSGDTVMECRDCVGGDGYVEWCIGVDCALDGRYCVGGACQIQPGFVDCAGVQCDLSTHACVDDNGTLRCLPYCVFGDPASTFGNCVFGP